VVGHSYIAYGPLLRRCTTVLFEGKPVGMPDAGTYWRVARDHGVEGLFTAPTAVRAIKKEDPVRTIMRVRDCRASHQTLQRPRLPPPPPTCRL